MAPFEGPIRRYSFSFFAEDDLKPPAALTWTERFRTWFNLRSSQDQTSNVYLRERGDPSSPTDIDPRGELYKRMISDQPPDEAFQRQWAWYLKFLDARIAETWIVILRDTLEGLAGEHSSADPAQIARVYEVLVVIAENIRTRSEFSIDDVVSDLRDKKLLKADCLTDSARQLVWIFAGYLTMLYDPDAEGFLDDAGAPQLCLRRLSNLARARSRARGTILTSFREDMKLAEEQFHRSLGNFGALLPKPSSLSPSDRPQFLGNVEHLNVAYLSADGLKKVAKLNIEWVNTLELHLQLDQRKRILRLFRFPTFCQLLYKEEGISFLHQLYYDHHKSQIRGEEPEYDLNFSDYLREVILSYRLLFGIDPNSHQAFRDEMQKWQFDGKRKYDKDLLLWQLCTGHGESKNMKELLASFDGEETSKLFALEDFPYLGKRLVELQRFAIWQKPNSWKMLWQDKRDVKDWWLVWTAWAVLIIGGGTVVLQFFQLAFQIWSTVMQYQSPTSTSATPAGGL